MKTLATIGKCLTMLILGKCALTFAVGVGIAKFAPNDVIYGKAVAIAIGSALVAYSTAITFVFVIKR